MRIDLDAVARTHRALTGQDLDTNIRFGACVDLGCSSGRDLARLVGTLIETLDHPGSVLDHPAMAASYQEVLIGGLLATLPHSASDGFRSDPRTTAPSAVRRAEDFLYAHSTASITLEKLASVSATSVRSLQRGFREHLGTTPMQRLRQIRLENARQHLLRPCEDMNVTAVALDVGFTHLGKFSAAYRARFGESPSETLRHSQRRVPLLRAN